MLSLIYKIPLSYYIMTGLVNFLASAGLGLFIYFKNKKANINKVFAFFCLTVAQWSLFYFIWLNTKNIKTAEFYLRTCMIGVIFMPVVFTHFILYLLSQKINKKILYIDYLISVIIAATVYTPLYATDFRPFLIFPCWGMAGIIFPFHLLHFFINVVYSHYRMIVAIKENYNPTFKKQITYVFIGTVMGYLGGIANYLCWYRVPIPPVPNILVSIYVASVAYAIARYRLMDINLVITRAGNFLIVYTLVLGTPFLLGYRYGQWKTATWAMLILATIGPFIYQYLKEKTENILLKEQRRYQNALRRASKDMTLIKDLKHLLKTMVDTLTETIRINYVAIYLFDIRKDAFILKANNTDKSFDATKPIPKDSTFIKYLTQIKNPMLVEDLKNANGLKNIEDCDVSQIVSFAQSINASLIIPTFVDNQMIGFFALGNKISGHTYTDDDLAVLSVLANQAALAIENAQFYEQAKIMEAERIQSEKFATIGRLATSAKHEINNPLQMICWNFDNMGLALNNMEANFSNMKKNLDETVNNMKTMIANLANNKTITPEILHSFNELNILFNKTFSILERRGTAESEFIKEVNDICSMVDTNKACLTKACENIKDESIKDTINGIVHSSGTLAKNVLKIKDAANLFRHNIKTAKENAQRIETQTQIMHDLPKELDKELTAIDVNKLMDASFGYAKQQTYWENLGDTPVEKNIPANIPKIRGYFSRLQLVFMNLIINAYQAMTDAGLKTSRDRLIKISANIDPKSDNFLEIHFSNKGPLISEENLERIFERDFTTKKEGHGLGLHIARIQVELNNGTIYVKNIEGFGPEFVVRLPIRKES